MSHFFTLIELFVSIAIIAIPISTRVRLFPRSSYGPRSLQKADNNSVRTFTATVVVSGITGSPSHCHIGKGFAFIRASAHC